MSPQAATVDDRGDDHEPHYWKPVMLDDRPAHGAVEFTCPETGIHFTIGMEMDHDGWSYCPHCGAPFVNDWVDAAYLYDE